MDVVTEAQALREHFQQRGMTGYDAVTVLSAGIADIIRNSASDTDEIERNLAAVSEALRTGTGLGRRGPEQ